MGSARRLAPLAVQSLQLPGLSWHFLRPSYSSRDAGGGSLVASCSETGPTDPGLQSPVFTPLSHRSLLKV